VVGRASGNTPWVSESGARGTPSRTPRRSAPLLLIVPNMGALYNGRMRIIALKTLRLFWEQHPDVRQALQAWYRDTKRATWTTPADIRTVYRNAGFVGHNRVVFNIRGNRYRLVVAINYAHSIVYICFIGSHQAYDTIDAATV
jgi:mRNA interferase HigB